MKKVASLLSVVAFLMAMNVNAQEPVQKKKKAKTEKSCSAEEKKSCSSEEKKSCDKSAAKKSCCASKKVEEKAAE
jgi:hypothetical protein